MRIARTPLLALSLLAAATITGCSRQTTTTIGRSGNAKVDQKAVAQADESGYSYDYYPSAEVYYDPSREVYFWHASAYWGVGKRLPSTYKLNASERKVVHLDTKMPYRAHQEVIARYPNPNPDRDPIYASVPTNDQ